MSGALNVVDLYPVVVMRLACPRPCQLQCSTVTSPTWSHILKTALSRNVSYVEDPSVA